MQLLPMAEHQSVHLMDTMTFKSNLFRKRVKTWCLCCNRHVRDCRYCQQLYIFCIFVTCWCDIGYCQHRLVTPIFVQSYMYCIHFHNLIVLVLGNFPHKGSHVVLDAGLIMANQLKWAMLVFALQCCMSISVQGAYCSRRVVL